jgi:hypothetical protein
MLSKVAVVALFVSTSVCAIAESADAQPHALASAAVVRIPMLFAGSVAVGYPVTPQCDPLVRRNAGLVAFPDHLAYRRRPPLVRKTPDGL